MFCFPLLGFKGHLSLEIYFQTEAMSQTEAEATRLESGTAAYEIPEALRWIGRPIGSNPAPVKTRAARLFLELVPFFGGFKWKPRGTPLLLGSAKETHTLITWHLEMEHFTVLFVEPFLIHLKGFTTIFIQLNIPAFTSIPPSQHPHAGFGFPTGVAWGSVGWDVASSGFLILQWSMQCLHFANLLQRAYDGQSGRGREGCSPIPTGTSAVLRLVCRFGLETPEKG